MKKPDLISRHEAIEGFVVMAQSETYSFKPPSWAPSSQMIMASLTLSLFIFQAQIIIACTT